MSEGAIEPTRVFRPAQQNQEIVTRTSQKVYDLKVTNAGDAGGENIGGRPGFLGRLSAQLPGPPEPVETIPGMPRFLASRRIIFFCWAVGMAYIAWDEWHNNGILPRPKRLWWTSATFLILAGVASVDVLSPLANILAIGFLVSLMMQYYNAEGQFKHSKGSNNG